MNVCCVELNINSLIKRFYNFIEEDYKSKNEDDYNSLDKYLYNESKQDNSASIIDILDSMFFGELIIKKNFAEKLKIGDIIGVGCFMNVEDYYLDLFSKMDDYSITFIVAEREYITEDEFYIMLVPCSPNNKDAARTKILMGDL